MEFGERLSRWRKSRHLTQQRLADLVGVSGPAICQFETGISKPSLDTLLAITGALKVTMATFWGRCPVGPS